MAYATLFAQITCVSVSFLSSTDYINRLFERLRSLARISSSNAWIILKSIRCIGSLLFFFREYIVRMCRLLVAGCPNLPFLCTKTNNHSVFSWFILCSMPYFSCLLRRRRRRSFSVIVSGVFFFFLQWANVIERFIFDVNKRWCTFHWITRAARLRPPGSQAVACGIDSCSNDGGDCRRSKAIPHCRASHMTKVQWILFRCLFTEKTAKLIGTS